MGTVSAYRASDLPELRGQRSERQPHRIWQLPRIGQYFTRFLDDSSRSVAKASHEAMRLVRAPVNPGFTRAHPGTLLCLTPLDSGFLDDWTLVSFRW